MKKLILTSLVIGLTTLCAFAQFGTCTPDQTYADSSFGLYPSPFDIDLNPTGGISDSACLNKYYEFVFTAVVGDTINLGVPQVFDSIRIVSIENLPVGFTHWCSNDCLFKRNELGCAVIFGTAIDSTDLGPHDLVIKAKVYLEASGSFGLDVTFPNTLVPGLSGNYYLFILPENSLNCVIVDAPYETANQFGSIRNLPNPFSATTTIEIDAYEAGAFQLQVTDMLGRLVHSRRLSLRSGPNQIEFDGSQLPAGLYFYTISNQRGQATQKMRISR